MSDLELNDLFASCMPALKKAAMRMLRNPQDAEDILQEGLLSAFRNLHQYEGRSSFSTWMHSIVRNASRMYYRRSAGFRTTPINLSSIDGSEPSEVDCVPDLRPSPEEAAIRKERAAILKSVVRELPPKQRAAIESFYVQGLGEREASKHLGVTESALKAQLHRSRRILTRRVRQVYLPDLRAESFEPQTMFRVSAARRRSSRTKGIASKSTSKAPIPCQEVCSDMNSLFLNCRPTAVRAELSLFSALSLLAALPSSAQTSGNPRTSAFVFNSFRLATQTKTASTAVASSPEGTILVGTVLPVVLRTSFSFDKCKPGQILRGKTDREVPLLQGSAIPKGADIVGHIVEVIPASKVANAKVSMRFDVLYLSGQRISLVTNLAAIGDDPDALWALAPDARGSYGFENLLIAHAGKTEPVGTIVLASQTHNLKLRNGDALLLRVGR